MLPASRGGRGAAFDDFTIKAQKVLLLPQRLELAFEAVEAVLHGRPLSMHLSGPNGVGKSAILLLVHLICTALGLPSVYIPRAQDFVSASRSPGGGDAFILASFWRQNADLIIENPALRRVFVAALQDAKEPFTTKVMDDLRDAMGKRTPGPAGLAVIMDEVQHITAEVKASQSSTAPATVAEAGRYMATNWYDWTNANSVFQRLSAASAHADRDTNPPDGYADCIRIVEPLDPDDRAALQAAPNSPAYIYDASAREYVVRLAGNVLRKLVRCSKLLPRDRSPQKAELESLWQKMWHDMFVNCSAWLSTVPEAERSLMAREVMALVGGQVQWGNAKILYDAGIVYRSAKSEFVYPISAAAAAVLLRVTSTNNLTTWTRLSSIADGRERGLELERQLLARLDGFVSTNAVPCKLLDGTPAAAIDMRCSYSLPFRHLSEVVALEQPVLYRPIRKDYACDGILMPAMSDAAGVAVVIECSTEDPTTMTRLVKKGKFFADGGVVAELRKSGRKAVVAFVYDQLLPKRSGLSVEAIAVSRGEPPPPRPSSSSTAAVVGAAAPPSPPALPVPGLGDASRVVDAPSLKLPLGLLV